MTSQWNVPNSDTTVHAILPDGRRVIRLDNASKWYIENLAEGTRKHVKLDEAVEVAMEGSVKFNVYGGTVFEARVRRVLAARRNLNAGK